MHRDTIMKITNKMQLFRLIYYSKSSLHVSGDVFAHHQSSCLYLQYLVIFTQVAVGWCLGRVETALVCSTCFRRCFCPSSGALDCIYSVW
jgi:hypothetical protein